MQLPVRLQQKPVQNYLKRVFSRVQMWTVMKQMSKPFLWMDQIQLTPKPRGVKKHIIKIV